MSPGLTDGNSRPDLLICSRCENKFSDPRLLPCIHTVCLECLRNAGNGKVEGDRMPCPVCREEFELPKDGLAGLKKNVFIQKLLDIEMLSSSQISCEFCSMENSEEIPKAVLYCIECELKICKGCGDAHRNIKTTQNHRFVYCKDASAIKELAQIYPPNHCEEHATEMIRLYCKTCKLPTCWSCILENHKSHEWSKIHAEADLVRKQMSTEVQKIPGVAKKYNQSSSDLEQKKQDLHKEISRVEKAIKTRKEDLKKWIDQHSEMLLNDLKSIKKRRLDGLVTARTGVFEEWKSTLEDLGRYMDEITLKGTDVEIFQSFNDINKRVEELKKSTNRNNRSDRVPEMPIQVSFTKSNVDLEGSSGTRNMVGKIYGKCMRYFETYLQIILFVQTAELYGLYYII